MSNNEYVYITMHEFQIMLSALNVVCQDYKNRENIHEYYKPVLDRMRAYCYHLENLNENIKIYKCEYPQNLLAAVRKIDPVDMPEELYDVDRRRGIAMALARLTEQEESMIILRYRYHKTLEQVGSQYNLTRERARQIINTGLRKLRYPFMRKLLDKGMNAYIDGLVNKHIEEYTSPKLCEEYIRGYNDGIKSVETEKEIAPEIINGVMELPISELDIPIDAYDCLEKAGNMVVEDLLKYNHSFDIRWIHGMDITKLRNIVFELRRLGLSNEVWETALKEEAEDLDSEFDWDFLSKDDLDV